MKTLQCFVSAVKEKLDLQNVPLVMHGKAKETVKQLVSQNLQCIVITVKV